MEELGHLWQPDLEVHHKNRNPKDNRPENLCLTTRAIHKAVHRHEKRMERLFLEDIKREAEDFWETGVDWFHLKALDLSEIAR